MTKPVQIQRYANNEDPRGFYPDEDGAWIKQADHVLAFLQVRSLLEAKAKEWGTTAFTLSHGKLTRFGVALRCRDELLSLAATLGNQGK